MEVRVMAKKAAIVWEELADGSWFGKENTPWYPRTFLLVQDRTVTHRTKIVLAASNGRRSFTDWPNWDVAKRAVVRGFRRGWY
jgi:hypothetical protein